MDPERPPANDLDVRLRWPAVEPGAEDVSGAPDSPEDTEEPTTEANGAIPVELEMTTSLARTSSPDPVLGSIAIRLDALANSTALLRSLIGERLADYSNQVARAQSLSTRDLEDYRRGHDRTLAEIEASLRESEGAVQHLERSVAATTSKLDEMGDKLHDRIERLEEQLEAMGSSLGQVESRLGVLAAPPTVDRDALEQLQQAVAQLGDMQSDEVERMIDAIERLPAADRLAALDERVDAIAEFVSRSSTADTEMERLADQVENLTRGVEILRKRIALRARQDAGLDRDAVQAIAASIAEQIAAAWNSPRPAPPRSRWRSGRA